MMNERPTSVTVISVINLLLSGLGLLFLTGAVVMRLGLFSYPGMEESPKYQLMQDNVGYRLLSDVLTGLGFVATIIVIAAAIGMFTLKPWARLATIGWGVYAMVTGLGMMVVDHVLVVNPTLAMYDGKPEYSVVWTSIAVGYGIAAVFFGYYLLMMWMLTRPRVVQAFTPEPMDDDYNEPGSSPTSLGGVDL